MVCRRINTLFEVNNEKINKFVEENNWTGLICETVIVDLGGSYTEETGCIKSVSKNWKLILS
jgi:hypothetical protein